MKRNFRWLRTTRENFSVLGSGADPLFLNPLRNATRFPFRSVRWRFTYVRAYVLSTVSSFYHFFMDVLHLLSLVSNERTRDDLMIRVRTNVHENVCVWERERETERKNKWCKWLNMRMSASETNSETLCAYICISVYRYLFQPLPLFPLYYFLSFFYYYYYYYYY